MLSWWSRKCEKCVACVHKRPAVSDEYAESDSKSVSDIELKPANAVQNGAALRRATLPSSSCCDIKQHIPRKILRWHPS
nr:unnamed protein product [Callosobruchus analis]